MRVRSLILFVDDDESTRFAANGLLTDEGYDVVLASDGREALAVFASARPALVLTDIQMPASNELLSSLGEISPSTPVVLLTAHNPIDAQRLAHRFGAAGFINKPLDLDRLLALVSSITERAFDT